MKNLRVALAVALIYAAGYGAALARRRPAANMTYFVYSENAALDRALGALFKPAYRLHQSLCAAARRPFLRHSGDRPPVDLENAPL